MIPWKVGGANVSMYACSICLNKSSHQISNNYLKYKPRVQMLGGKELNVQALIQGIIVCM